MNYLTLIFSRLQRTTADNVVEVRRGEKGAIRKKDTFTAAGAASQCYQAELMLSKWELMLFKCKINTNTKKKWKKSYKMFR